MGVQGLRLGVSGVPMRTCEKKVLMTVGVTAMATVVVESPFMSATVRVSRSRTWSTRDNAASPGQRRLDFSADKYNLSNKDDYVKAMGRQNCKRKPFSTDAGNERRFLGQPSPCAPSQ